MENLEVGDIVTLKSGGPDMVIQYIRGNIHECWWFDGSKCKHIELPREALNKAMKTDGN